MNPYISAPKNPLYFSLLIPPFPLTNNKRCNRHNIIKDMFRKQTHKEPQYHCNQEKEKQ